MPEPKTPRRAVFSATLPAGELLETIHSPSKRRTAFLVGLRDDVREVPSLPNGSGETLVPYSAGNNLLVHGAVLLPSGIEPFGTPERIFGEIEEFLRQYVALTPEQTTVAATYVLLTWVYDRFNEVPYLRVRGDYGSGKSRFLSVVGSIAYKGIFASGASTVSPLFRLLDCVAGTLIVDEGDFRFSDEKTELIKILNNGNARGFPVLRTETSPQKEFNPTAFSVFGPKLIATRSAFDDKALESRCITFEMPGGSPPSRIPVSLPTLFRAEATSLRNKLLAFRFSKWAQFCPELVPELEGLEPRTRQILEPLLAVAPVDRAREAVRSLGATLDDRMRGERRSRPEALLAGLVLGWTGKEAASVGDLARGYAGLVEDSDTASPRWIGFLLRERLGLRTEKRHGVFVLVDGQEHQLMLLRQRFGISDAGTSGMSGTSRA